MHDTLVEPQEPALQYEEQPSDGYSSFCPSYSFDEARLMANVNTRAARLYRDGYRAKRLTAHTVRVTSPEQSQYVVDLQEQTCECPFFVKHKRKFFCKHLLGVDQLLADQQEARRQNGRQWAALAGIVSMVAPPFRLDSQQIQEATR